MLIRHISITSIFSGSIWGGEDFMSEMEWLGVFSGNLRDLMNETGMTQEELSEKTGIDRSTISRYLNKKRMPTVRAIVNLTYALNCNISDLIDFGDYIE